MPTSCTTHSCGSGSSRRMRRRGKPAGRAGWQELAGAEAGRPDRHSRRRGLDRRRARPALRGALARCGTGARHPGAGRAGRQGLVARGGPGRDRARPAGRPGARHGGGAGALPRRGARRDGSGPGGAADGRLRHARAVHAGREPGRMVRARPAGAHQPLHGEAAARRDRAGVGAGLPALPAHLAARRRRRRAWRGRWRSRRSSSSWRASRRRRRRGRGRSLAPGSAATSPAGSTTPAGPAAPPGCGCGTAPAAPTAGRAAPVPSNRRPSPCCRAGTWPRGGRSPTRTPRPRSRAMPRRWPPSSASTARRSSTTSWRARACSGRRWRTRWRSWPPTAW